MAVVWQGLHTYTVTLNLSLCFETIEIRHNVFGETELTGDENGLASSELELGTTKSHLGMLHVGGLGPDGHKD